MSSVLCNCQTGAVRHSHCSQGFFSECLQTMRARKDGASEDDSGYPELEGMDLLVVRLKESTPWEPMMNPNI